MEHTALIGLVSVVVLGIVSQWLAWLLRLPAILLLLIGGFLIGPVTGFLQPDHLFGPTLFPAVTPGRSPSARRPMRSATMSRSLPRTPPMSNRPGTPASGPSTAVPPPTSSSRSST